MNRRRAAAAVVVLVLGTVLLLAAPARAQVPPIPVPPIPVPPLPEELAPVLEIVAPVVSPPCGIAVLVTALAPGLVAGLLGAPLPVELSPLFGPLIVVCAAVPLPEGPLTCSADETVMTALNTVARQ
ncbi:MAG: hypothetical protein ACRD0U_06750, partial [Acidimicrobiales bacterium]